MTKMDYKNYRNKFKSLMVYTTNSADFILKKISTTFSVVDI